METMMNIVLICVAFVITANASPFKPCPGSPNNVKSMEIGGCTAAPCSLHHSTNATFEVDFKAVSDAKQLTAKVYGIIGGVPIPFPIPNPDGCKGSGITCPVKSGGMYSYKNAIPVKPSYPKIQLYVKWVLNNEANKEEFCVLIPVKIVD